MRNLGVILHRWFGLFTAIFLFISGLTGAVISWDHELDEWLNPEFYKSISKTGVVMAPVELADLVEKANPHVIVTFMPLSIESGHTFQISVSPKLDASTGKLFESDYNQLAINPENGEILAKRMWGKVSLSRENILPFLYKLHYTMHIPDGWGIELGVIFMGIVGIAWFFDSFIALWLSFPKWSVWRKSLSFRRKSGSRILNFDLHRSGGVWVWLLLLMMALTSISMNLNNEVMRPIVSKFSKLTPSPFAQRAPNPKPENPLVSREQILSIAHAEAIQRGWSTPAGGMFYSPALGIYGIGFYEPENDHGDDSLGNPWLYFDDKDGNPAGENLPGTGTAGDIFMQAQFPIHSGRILGLTGRILISLMGVVVAMLSMTGVIIWFRKRQHKARNSHRAIIPRIKYIFRNIT